MFSVIFFFLHFGFLFFYINTDKIQRKDRKAMTEEDNDALLPYGGFVMLFNMLSSNNMIQDNEEYLEVKEEDIFEEWRQVERKDGTPMDEDDDEVLLPYSGMISMFSLLSNLSGEIDSSPTGHFDEEESSSLIDVFENISRKDGENFTQEDHDSLLEFGGMLNAMKLMTLMVDMMKESCGDVNNGQISRKDGEDLDEDDEIILMEYYPAFKFMSNTYDLLCPTLAEVFYPDEDEQLTYYGEQLGKVTTDESVVDTDHLIMHFVGHVFSQIYQRVFGSLASPWDASNSQGKDTGMKRKPSGAELSAWIGLATQKTFGLDDPSRRVRARGVL